MPDVVLTSSPGLLGLYAKVALGALPRARVPLVGGSLRRLLPGGLGATGGTVAAADLVLRLEGVAIEPGRLAAYRRVCGFDSREPVPATYPHVLAFPLHLALLTDPSFPFTALGAVHIANTIEQQRPLRVDESFAVTVRATGEGPHPRGRQISLVTEVEARDKVIWSERTLLLHREGRPTHPAAPAAPTGDPSASAASTHGGPPMDAPSGPLVWRLPSSLGRRYASVSGDRNPIHLYDVTARPLGFSRHIAHGMWTTARAVAELSNRVGDAFILDVAFKKPISLPGSVRFGARDDGARIRFGVSQATTGAPHLLGHLIRR